MLVNSKNYPRTLIINKFYQDTTRPDKTKSMRKAENIFNYLKALWNEIVPKTINYIISIH